MISEADFFKRLKEYADFTYGEGRYPLTPVFTGPKLKLFGGKKQTNCCCFVEGMLAPFVTWNHFDHRAMMILNADRKFSPIDCVVNKGLGRTAWYPSKWALAQGWNEDGRGHTFFVAEATGPFPNDRLLILEANRAWGIDGVGYRSFGNIADVGIQGPQDWRSTSLWDWERLAAVYPFLQLAALDIF